MDVPAHVSRTALVLALALLAAACGSSGSDRSQAPTPGGVNFIISGVLLPELANITSNLSVLAGRPEPCGPPCTRDERQSGLWGVVLLRCQKVPPGGFSGGNGAGWPPGYLALDSALARWCRTIERLALTSSPASTHDWDIAAIQMYDEISRLRDAAAK